MLSAVSLGVDPYFGFSLDDAAHTDLRTSVFRRRIASQKRPTQSSLKSNPVIAEDKFRVHRAEELVETGDGLTAGIVEYPEQPDEPLAPVQWTHRQTVHADRTGRVQSVRLKQQFRIAPGMQVR